jgi:hypothetical protein
MGSSNAANLRVIDASPDAGAIDVSTGGTGLAYNLELGTITSYVPLMPGQTGMVLHQAGTQIPLGSAQGMLAAGGQYTALVLSGAAGAEPILLRDQSVAAAPGQVAMRFVDANAAAGGVDLYLVPSGATLSTGIPVKRGLGFAASSGYLSVPAGTYTLMVLPTGEVGSDEAVYTGPAVSYASGSARTFVLTSSGAAAGTMNVIVGDDFDVAGPSQ